ncbi:MAG: hypothetical protein ACRESZ_05390 [Methylococcales bacterium]
MPRFFANLNLLFSEYPLLERFRAANNCGFDAIEGSGYRGWPGAKYKSTGATSDSLGWLNEYR